MGVQKTTYSDNAMSRRSIAKVLVAAVLIVLGIFPLNACQKEKKAEPERMVNVRVWPAEVKKVQPYLETTGTLKADEEVMVSSEVDGLIKKITVDVGTAVGSGMLLAEINETDYQLDWKRSEAALKQAQASLANAKAEYKRKDALYQEELITKQQFDDISTRVALAEAELERAKATLAISRERFVRTKIYSPLVGSVKEKKVSVGDYVRNGTPLLQLIKINPLKLNFTVSEKDVAGLRIGQEVSFTVDAFPGKQFKGKVSLLYPNVEERTRTLQAEAMVPNANHMLKPGYFARIQIFTQAARDTVVVPITALLYDGPVIRVFVVNGNKAQERIIKTGNKYGEYMEIPEGLKEKEQVVVVGQNNLSEGVKVNVAR
ncbi:MAG: HlyD family secretion protein [Syntrophaceae bacterium]|nr:MAG: HlyD family secretion protein [Syntrophaceae bacterium]